MGPVIIRQDDVSAVFTEIESSDKVHSLNTAGILVLLMDSGKEFRFKYHSYLEANIQSMILLESVRVQTATDITL